MEILGCFSVMKIKAPHPPSPSPPPPPPHLYLILGNFILDKNQLYLPALILVCTKPTYQFDSKIFDGSAVVHFLPTASAITFADYAIFTSWKTQTGLIVSGMVIVIAASRS